MTALFWYSCELPLQEEANLIAQEGNEVDSQQVAISERNLLLQRWDAESERAIALEASINLAWDSLSIKPRDENIELDEVFVHFPLHKILHSDPVMHYSDTTINQLGMSIGTISYQEGYEVRNSEVKALIDAISYLMYMCPNMPGGPSPDVRGMAAYHTNIPVIIQSSYFIDGGGRQRYDLSLYSLTFKVWAKRPASREGERLSWDYFRRNIEMISFQDINQIQSISQGIDPTNRFPIPPNVTVEAVKHIWNALEKMRNCRVPGM
jgi:hypothetical protein